MKLIRLIDIIERKMNGVLTKMMKPQKCKCMFCGNEFHHYYLHGYDSEVVRKHTIPCMGIRRGDCPYCFSTDKNRWLWWVLENKTQITKKDNRILHFAPEGRVQQEIRKYIGLKGAYISGDIVPGRADEVVDITNIKYADESFDIVIASMVMEHIVDEAKALEEIMRVLAEGGQAVLTVPVAIDIENTQEDESIITEEDRRKYYGQEDHVRLYGRDIEKRWGAYCRNITAYKPSDCLSTEMIRSMGVPPEYYVFVLEK